MGNVTIQEFLADREACSSCSETGNEQHCITALLSRQDSCIIYNSMFINQDSSTVRDTALLQNIRSTNDPNTVLDYYVRSQAVTERINANSNKLLIWNQIYNTYIKPILVKLRLGKNNEVMADIMTMLEEVESRY